MGGGGGAAGPRAAPAPAGRGRGDARWCASVLWGPERTAPGERARFFAGAHEPGGGGGEGWRVRQLRAPAAVRSP